MDDFNKLATIDEITDHYKSLDVPVPICWLLNGKLNFLTGGNTGMDINFSSGTIYSELDDITGTYELLRFENGYMMYNIIFPINRLSLNNNGDIVTSNDLLYDAELPAHFTKLPNTTVSFSRNGFAECVPYVTINSDHETEYLPTIKLAALSTSFLTANGYICIQMEGF